MRKIINNLENSAIRRYGFESRRTILTFKLTDLMRKACGYGY
jgi:hypothetical protein